MLFTVDGKCYDTENLITILPGPSGPTALYVSKDHREVFVQSFRQEEGVTIKRATPSNVKYLAGVYGHPDLVEAARLAAQ